jgi:Mrp family chromosome partitioning ATPase
VLPEQLWSVLRRYWAAIVVITVIAMVAFVGLAVKGQRPYHSSVTLNVQAPVSTGTAAYNTQAVLQAVPVIEARLTTADLKTAVEGDTRQYAGSFKVTVAIDPNSTVIGVTVASVNQDLVVPALNSLVTRITKYTKDIGLPVVITELQTPNLPVRDGVMKKAALGAAEGLVFGLAFGTLLALALARLRQYRDLKDRLETTRGLKTLVALPEPHEPGAGREDEFVLLAADIRADIVSRRASSFAVVSPRPGATRSVTAAQLARGLAVAGHRVLLVDTDLRAPRLEGALASIDASPVAPFTGLGWLPTETTNVPNLVVLRGMALPKVVEHLGMQGTGPVRLVAGSIASIVGEARNANVVLIVDCPAPETGAEASAVLSAVDAAIIVTSGRLTRRDADKVGALSELITRLGTEIIGLVAGPKKDYNLRPVPTRSPV